MGRRPTNLIAAGLCLAVAAMAVARGVPAWRRHVAAVQDREVAAAVQHLRDFDAARRKTADFANLATWDRRSGPDPYAVQELAASGFVVGVLRGSDAVVVLDASLREVQRLPAPRSPAALIVSGDTVLVAGELAASIARFRWRGTRLEPAGTVEVEGVRAIRGIAAGPGGWIYLVEEQRGRLVALEVGDPAAPAPLAFARRRDLAIGNGPVRIVRVADRLIIDCLLDHALVIQRLEPSGEPAREPPIRIVQDGPTWSFAVRELDGGALLVATGGVEDHPLDRTIGAFGYIDSFLYLYRVDLGARRATRAAAVDLGDHGLAVPKALAFARSTGAVRVTGYGTSKLLEVSFGARAPSVTTTELVPGTNAMIERSDGALVLPDPLLDAWILARPGGTTEIVPVPTDVKPDPAVRLGEALVFTTLIAPFNRSEGPLSRFTCETCHFEGYGDGRIHHTGRGDVHAVTKPLLGLFNNRPHFSRALDPDLVSVAFNEFRVAGARSDHDPWFALRSRDAPWLAALGVGDEWLSPERLREAFMSFLIAFNHRPNPAALGRSRVFSPEERTGAGVFRDRCESCHEARLASDEPDSRVPFERWEDLLMTHDGPIVWGKAEYAKTGVVPYVHAEGARVPSLRRLYKKRPYFTNGSARDLPSVLARARFAKDRFWHDAGDAPVDQAGASAPLAEREQHALLVFLDLL